MKLKDFLLGPDPARQDTGPIIERTPAKERPSCVCTHSHAMHGPGGRGKCALWKPNPEPGTCWCDSYEPVDEGRFGFPVTALEQPADE